MRRRLWFDLVLLLLLLAVAAGATVVLMQKHEVTPERHYTRGGRGARYLPALPQG